MNRTSGLNAPCRFLPVPKLSLRLTLALAFSALGAGFAARGAQSGYSVPIAWGLSNSVAVTNLAVGLNDAVAISAGSGHNLALRSNGTVFAWGSTNLINVPAGLSNVAAVSACYNSLASAALRNGGTVIAWGDNSDGQTNVPAGLSNVAAIAMGYPHCLALKSNGTVVAWGNGCFQADPRVPPAGLQNVVKIAAGYCHSMALKADGTVVVWATNDFAGRQNVPAGLSNVIAISAGYDHDLALKSDGTVVAWGLQSVPAGLCNVVAIMASWQFSLALKSDGTVVAWGNNTYGQTSVPVGLGNGVLAVSAGRFHSLVLHSGWPVFVTQPSSAAVLELTNVLLSAKVLGVTPMNFQWFHDGSPVLGATNSSLTLSNVHVADTGDYALRASNVVGVVTSAPAVLTVSLAPPVITLQPSNVVVDAGSGVTLTAAASGSQPLAYQWLKSGVAISGETNDFIALPSVQLGDAGFYSLRVTNAVGAVTSAPAALAVRLPISDALDGSLNWTTGGSAPWYGQSVATHEGVDAGRSGAIGDNEESWVETTVLGPGTLTFWWKVSSSSISGGDNLEFYLNSNRLAAIRGEVDWGQKTFYLGSGTQTLRWRYQKDFCCIAGADAGWLDEVTYTPGGVPPIITGPPTNVLIASGLNATFGILSTGTPPIRLQWRFNDAEIAGATNRLLTVTNVQSNNAGIYTAVARNDFGVVLADALLTLEVKPSVFWAVSPSLPGAGSSLGNTIAVAANGESYVAGVGYESFPGASNPAGGPGFLAKFGADGAVLWVQPLGASGHGVAVGSDGCVYASGRFGGSGWIGQSNASSPNALFLAKFDLLTGSNRWTRFAGSAFAVTEGPVIAVGAGGEVYIAGNTFGNALFGSTNVFTQTDDVFIAKYDVDGDFFWVRTAGSTSYGDGARGVSVDTNGNAYVAGYVATPAPFGSNNVNSYSCCGYTAAFLAKYSGVGDLLWLRSLANIYEDPNGDYYGSAVAVDRAGNAYTAGHEFDTSGTAGNYYRVWTRRYSATGSQLSAPSTTVFKSSDFSRAITVDLDGNAVVAGEFSGAIQFGTSAALKLETPDTNAPWSDAFIARLNAAGSWLWAEKVTGLGRESARATALGADGSVYVTGYFQTNATIGTNGLSGDALTNLFVARLGGSPAQLGPVRTEVSTGTPLLTLQPLVLGPGDLSYQWYRNGVLLAGQTNVTLLLAGGAFGDTAGQFSLVVSNQAGFTSNLVARLGAFDLAIANELAQLQIAGAPGLNFLVQYLDSLTNTPAWLLLTNFTLSSGTTNFTDDASAGLPTRFYRVGMGP
ncbi:MAG TPA: immunoglobulin domain-containing protein [Verrucomicrobiae bacterium]